MMQVATKTTSTTIYAIVTADVVGSRRIAGFRKKRDALLAPASDSQRKRGLILAPYSVTVWDEFQTIVTSPHLFPQVVLDLRRNFYPMELRIAVGLGRVSEPKKVPINQFAGGEAFERARSAMDELKNIKGSKYPVLTAVESGDQTFDMATNAILQLQDTLAGEVSPAQWKTVRWVAQLGSLELAAKKLRVNISTVSRTLRRAHYWQIEETCQAAGEFVRGYLALAR